MVDSRRLPSGRCTASDSCVDDVAFGVLLDTLIVRSLLVPAMTLQIGRKISWLSALSRGPA
ncbi:hypothetical protein ALI144C_09265 [Actinosynnema sp. ALI-1.44]|nr:hypothetical protein ALI144C_09265 [Actinosynnema sp. ALI-1.44]